MFSILFDNSFTELPGSKPENLGKVKTYLTFQSMCRQGKM